LEFGFSFRIQHPARRLVSHELRAASPPIKPLLVFDGDCGFCRRWITRWQSATDDAVEYLPFQDESVARRFPEIPRQSFEHAVQLILPDGRVLSAARAVFGLLALGGRERWLLWCYQKIPPFAWLSEWTYKQVAAHRSFLSKLDRLFLGSAPGTTRHILVRYLFLRGLALVYLIAFASFWAQAPGLIGSQGIVPAQSVMEAVRAAVAREHIGLERFRIFPTAAWWGVGDHALNWQCGAGVILSLCLLAGIAPAAALFLLWLLYLSLCTISSPFLDFQWDNLLLEAGFLAILLAPLQWVERPLRQPGPSRIVVWLFRWLLFRLMIESGAVKLLSGDASWRNLSALRVHYETQPLPTWVAWYVHQSPLKVHQISAALMFLIELAVPVLIFAGRRPRLWAAAIFASFQFVVLLTGNYTFFNWLTMLLGLLLLDDRALMKLWPGKGLSGQMSPALPARRLRWDWKITVPVAALVILVTFIGLLATLRIPQPDQDFVLYNWVAPLRTFNNYGLFRVMTPTRPEIIIEGSNDRRIWLPYEFKYKPGPLDQRPAFVAPYQPRLDWQMWFAALGSVQNNRWFLSFEYQLLRNSPAVLGLLERNPFPNAAPKYIRAQLYEYHFTDRATRQASGNWWKREFLHPYVPPLSLQDFERANAKP
jgi:lipase maturation factor 1